MGSTGSTGFVLVGFDDSEPDDDEDDAEDQEHNSDDDEDQLNGLLGPHEGNSCLEGH